MRHALSVAVLGLALTLGSAGAAAQDSEEAAGRGAAFEAADEGATENIPGGLLMVGAYGFLLVLLFGYVASLGFRQAATNRELLRLREDLGAGAFREGPDGEG